MSYEKDVKITFYNMEDGEEVSDEYSEFLMINRDGEVFELVHNGRGDYKPSYEGDWVGYKMESRAKADEYEAKAKAWDNMKRDFEEISHTPMAQHILFNMSLIMEDVESGKSDA